MLKIQIADTDIDINSQQCTVGIIWLGT